MLNPALLAIQVNDKTVSVDRLSIATRTVELP